MNRNDGHVMTGETEYTSRDVIINTGKYIYIIYLLSYTNIQGNKTELSTK